MPSMGGVTGVSGEPALRRWDAGLDDGPGAASRPADQCRRRSRPTTA